MPAIGHVNRSANGGFAGELHTVSIKANIEIVPNEQKASDTQPDYRVLTEGVEIGGGWNRRSEASGRDYVSLSLAAPEFGPRRIYANLARASRSEDETFAIIWNPID